MNTFHLYHVNIPHDIHSVCSKEKFSEEKKSDFISEKEGNFTDKRIHEQIEVSLKPNDLLKPKYKKPILKPKTTVVDSIAILVNPDEKNNNSDAILYPC